LFPDVTAMLTDGVTVVCEITMALDVADIGLIQVELLVIRQVTLLPLVSVLVVNVLLVPDCTVMVFTFQA
jgi:hypothetical protein